MRQPEGFIKVGQQENVCLYDLKQSPCQWYRRFDSYVLSLDFLRCEHDCYIYMKDVNEDDALYLLFIYRQYAHYQQEY